MANWKKTLGFLNWKHCRNWQGSKYFSPGNLPNQSRAGSIFTRSRPTSVQKKHSFSPNSSWIHKERIRKARSRGGNRLDPIKSIPNRRTLTLSFRSTWGLRPRAERPPAYPSDKHQISSDFKVRMVLGAAVFAHIHLLSRSYSCMV
jgi:hypothetical protein